MNSPLLEIQNVKKRYKDFEALKGVSLMIKHGEIISLLGVNGAGKTTLSSIIATLHPATAGDILFEGKSIYRDIPWYRRHMGYCQQRPNLNPFLTLQENLEFAGRYFCMNEGEIKQRIEELSEQLGLKEYLSKNASVLSGGYKQRFMIARSLMHTPKLIILDEPTVALDPHIRRNLWEYIRKLKQQGISVLLTTHYIDEAEFLSDRVCVLHKGVVKLIDTPQNLMNSFQKCRLEDVFLQLAEEQPETESV